MPCDIEAGGCTTLYPLSSDQSLLVPYELKLFGMAEEFLFRDGTLFYSVAKDSLNIFCLETILLSWHTMGQDAIFGSETSVQTSGLLVPYEPKLFGMAEEFLF